MLINKINANHNNIKMCSKADVYNSDSVLMGKYCPYFKLT